MNKVSIRVDYTLPNESLEEQIRIAAACGADAVETGELMGYDCAKAAAVAASCGVRFVSCGFYDLLHTRVGAPFVEVRDNLMRTIEGAKTLGTNLLMSLTIDEPNREESSRARFAENLQPVLELCAAHGMLLLLEPHATKYVNPVVDMSRYYMNSIMIADDAMQRLGQPENLKLLFDVYHCQTMDGDLTMNIRTHLPKIAHFHLAGVPGRDELTNGEIHYPNLIRTVANLGYDGYFGLEYFPADTNDHGELARMVQIVKNA